MKKRRGLAAALIVAGMMVSSIMEAAALGQLAPSAAIGSADAGSYMSDGAEEVSFEKALKQTGKIETAEDAQLAYQNIEIHDLFFEDAQDGRIETLPANGTVTAVFSVYNPNKAAINATVLIAQYGKENLYHTDTLETPLSAASVSTVKVPFQVIDCKTRKAFFWTQDTMVPLCDAYALESENTEQPVYEDNGGVADFVLLRESFQYPSVNALPFSKSTPIWSNTEVFNSTYIDAEQHQRPCLENATGETWTGAEEWSDYMVSANVSLEINEETTLLLAVRHNSTLFYGDSFYAAGVYAGRIAVLKYARSYTGEPSAAVLTEAPCNFGTSFNGQIAVQALDNRIILLIDGQPYLTVTDDTALLTAGNAGIVAENADAVFTDFTVYQLYDPTGGHVDNWLHAMWEAPIDNLAALLRDSEQVELMNGGSGKLYYTAPTFSLDMDSLQNEIPDSGGSVSAKATEKSGRYCYLEDGVDVQLGSPLHTFSAELETLNAEGAIASSYDASANQIWSASLENGMLTLTAGEISESFSVSGYTNDNAHLLFTYNGSDFTVYLDAVRIGVLQDVNLQPASSFRFLDEQQGALGLLRIYPFALTADEARLRYGDGFSRFGDTIPPAAESLDFTRYVHENSEIMENKGTDHAAITLCDNYTARKEYERSVLNENIYYLNTISSTRNTGIFIGEPGDASAYKNADELTIAFWINISSPRNGQSHRIVSLGDKERTQFGLEIFFVNETMYVLGSEFANAERPSKQKAVDMSDYVNRWCHLVLTRRYLRDSGTWQIGVWADGTCLYQETIASERVDESDMILSIAAQPNGNNGFWGYIGEADVYTQYFTPDEIRNLYRKGIVKFQSLRIH